VEPDGSGVSATERSPISKIYIRDPAIRTQHGLHVGSSLADLKDLGAVEEPTKSGSYHDSGWVIHGYAGQLVAWVDSDTDTVSGLEVTRNGMQPDAVGEITPCD
jgi:hypothetical protein